MEEWGWGNEQSGIWVEFSIWKSHSPQLTGSPQSRPSPPSALKDVSFRARLTCGEG